GARLARQAAAADGLPGGYGELVEPVVGSRCRDCARVTAGFALGECCPHPGARGLPAPAAVATAAAAAVLRRFGCRAGLGAHLGDLGDGFGGDLVGDFLLVGHFAVDLRHLRHDGSFTVLALLHDLLLVLILLRVRAGFGLELDGFGLLLLLHRDPGDRHDGRAVLIGGDDRLVTFAEFDPGFV